MYLSTEEKSRILAWKYEMMPNSEIARRTGRSARTIKHLIEKSRGL
jgi:IS30 family transposase